MRATIQRVKQAAVDIEGELMSEINLGLLVLLGICPEDTEDDILWLCRKISSLRIFSNSEGKMNYSLIDVKGDILLISQFTLYAKTKNGNRPSYINSASPKVAEPIYDTFKITMEKVLGKEIFAGKFGANMQVYLCNDGPVTINIDSKKRE